MDLIFVIHLSTYGGKALQKCYHLFGFTVVKFLCHGNLRDLERYRLGYQRWRAAPEHGWHWLPGLTPVSWNPGKMVEEPRLYFRLCMSFSKHATHWESIPYLAILYTPPDSSSKWQAPHSKAFMAEMKTVKAAGSSTRNSSAAWNLPCDGLSQQLLSDEETGFLCPLAQRLELTWQRDVWTSLQCFPKSPPSPYLQDHSVLQRCLRHCLQLVAKRNELVDFQEKHEFVIIF